ncbi:MAG: hypothetical protein JSR59_24755, partial [Proteobacteria bacterium]|nr:hypothetical protein [Pseudomonadota bacterium]
MHVLDLPRRFDGAFIEIPSFHRTHAGLFPEAKVHLCCFFEHGVGERAPGQPTDALSELIVSPIDFQHWSRVWRFAGKFRERPGLVNDIFAILKEHNVAVISAESCNVKEHPRREGVHYVEALVILDPTISPAVSSDETTEGLRARLDWALKAVLFDDLIMRADGRPQLSLKPVSALQDAARAFSRLSAQARGSTVDAIRSVARIEGFSDRDVGRDRGPQPAGASSKVTHFLSRRAKLVLPQDIKTRLLLELHARREHNAGYAIRISDTKDRVLRVLFSRHDQPIVSARIMFDSTPRSPDAITRALRDAGFDIVSSFISRSTVAPRGDGTPAAGRSPLGDDGLSVFEVILRYHGEAHAKGGSKRDAESIKSRVRSALETETCAGLSIGLSFPKNYSKDWEPEWITTSRPAKRRTGSVRAEAAATSLETSRALPRNDRYMQAPWKYRSVAVGDAKEGLPPSDPQRVVLANALNDYYLRNQLGDSSNGRHTVFISSHFSNPGLLATVEMEAKRRLLRTIVARDTQAYECKR